MSQEQALEYALTRGRPRAGRERGRGGAEDEAVSNLEIQQERAYDTDRVRHVSIDVQPIKKQERDTRCETEGCEAGYLSS